MRVLLVSTYELGHQPFGLASPAGWLERDGHKVECADLSVSQLPPAAAQQTQLAAFYLSMHTATRLAVPVIEFIRKNNPAAHLCCFGLYAALNEPYLRQLGVHTILSGEFEAALAMLANRLERGEMASQTGPFVILDRLKFLKPDRSGLPALAKYPKLRIGEKSKVVAYTEASRGCKHLCRHCPVVPVYKGVFRVVQPEIVLADIRQQIFAGAEHVTFGDPDFFNGPAHAFRIVEELHREFPGVTYDATIKIEHLRKNREKLSALRDTGCLFVTSAVESVDNAVLEKLDKGHTVEDFRMVVKDFAALGMTLSPTFIPFTPWTTLEGYRELLRCIAGLDLIENTGAVQLALRLLIPSGSRLLELDDIQAAITGFDGPALLHRWAHPDPAMDQLAREALKTAAQKGTRQELFGRLWQLAYGEVTPPSLNVEREPIPYMDEPWYCCAEPTEGQLPLV